MKLIKPTWINHDGHPIFSIDIHPDDTRFATGGQGSDSVGRIVIWNMLPVLQLEENGSIEVPKILCQLDHHNACVNSVRWSHSGRYLASGGDDKIIIIWKMTAKLGSLTTPMNSSGFCKPAYEVWKPVFTLTCHTGDVLHLAWSPQDKYLASASVDNTVIVWNAQNFPHVVAQLKDHTSLVKGVTWDPVGKYLASQSDDKSVKIWRTSDWTLEHSVTDSFTECGGTTHVLRLDWSPDGVYLVSAHAMNAGGPTAQIVERDGWKTDKDFVGHRKAVVCVRFTRTMLHHGKSQMCCVALGSRDRSISIWSTALKRPLVVVRDAFTHSIMDLCWSTSARIMMACSWDGTAAVAYFTGSEIGKPLSNDEMTNLHHHVYGKNVANNTCNLVQNMEVFLARQRVKEECAQKPEAPAELRATPEKQISPSIENVIRGPIDRQIETRTADGKRRITPKFLLPPDRTLPLTATSEPSEDMIFGEISEVSNLTNQSSLRDNMVSGIEDIKMTSETKTPTSVNGVEPSIQDDRNEIATTFNGTAEKNNSLSSSSPRSQSAETQKENDNTGTEIQSNMNSCAAEPVLSPADVHQPTSTNSLTKSPEVAASTSAVVEREKLDNMERGLQNEKQMTPVVVGVKRKRSDSDDMKPPNAPRKKKLQQTASSSVESEEKQPLNDVNSHAVDYSHNNGIVLAQAIRSSSTASASPAQNIHKCPTQPRRLLPMKIDNVFSCKINTKRDVSYMLEVENKRKGAISSVLRCKHELASFHGLEWSISTESPVCGVVGDMFRIIVTCEDFTIHVLDLKGRYAFPPILVPSQPSRVSQNGPYLMIITVKASLHVWNIHTKKIHIKSETILPLLNQPGNDPGHSIDVSYASVAMNGAPMLILSNGKTFVFSLDMQTWMMISDPCAPAKLNLIRGDDMMHQEPPFSAERKRAGNQQHSVITSIKLKLASATELRKAADVRKWILILAKSLANYDLRQELHQLCEDLLGPTHSSAQPSNSWSPTLVGVDKRDVLKEILAVLLEDLRWQDFYCEFSDLLSLAENSQLPGHSLPAQETHNGTGK